MRTQLKIKAQSYFTNMNTQNLIYYNNRDKHGKNRDSNLLKIITIINLHIFHWIFNSRRYNFLHKLKLKFV